MEELFEDLKRYLEEHFISYSILQILNDERPVVIINGEKHQLSLPNNEGSFFDESFCWDSDRTEYDYYIFRFGGIWYRLKAGEESSVKLERVLWLGNAEFSEPCLKVDCFLGVHGPFELLNGSGLYKEWCQKANFLGIKSLGICEKGTLAGILKFQEACKKANIRPIFGMEIPIKVEEKDLQYTVKAFVKNEQGWLNILEINRIINVENGYVTEKEIEQLREGLIIILDPKTIEFEDVSKLWKMFSQQFYYQLDTVVYEKEDRDKWYLQNLKKFFDSNFSPIAMCDAYYLEREYAYNRVRLNKIAGTMSYESQNQYFKNNQEYYFELGELFGDFDSFFDVFEAAVNNLKDVCSKCDYTIETGQRHLPKYYMTEEESKLYPDNKTMFTELVFKGMEDHLDLIEDYGIDVVGERIDREIKVITEGDVIDYFLILRDIVNWCKKNNILLGAGRGSAAGCLCSYLLGITNVNPLRYGLLFERFLNEGRAKVSLPDIDTDFGGEQRPLVKEYMEQRFGQSQVCSVGTYTTLQLKAAITDLCRQEGVDIPTVRRFTSKLGLEKEKTADDFWKTVCASEELRNFVKKYSDMFNDMLLILGQPKAASIHACAMMIFPDNKTMYEWAPVRKQKDMIVSEWEGGELDAAGFLKEDVLGIEQLDKFTDILNLVEEHHGKRIDLYKDIPLDDKKVFSYFQKGFLGDVFHFGAKGLSSYCVQMGPSSIDELSDCAALYRPGTIENNFHNEYLLRRSGEREVEYHIGTEEILGQTYGLFVYQEQVMALMHELAGMDLVTCDTARKAMGKKKIDVIKSLETKFIEGYCSRHGVTPEYAKDFWDEIVKASSYLFNKSHSVAYSINGYNCEWLKVHYPIEFWSVAFSRGSMDDFPYYINEIRNSGDIEIRPVDINKSEINIISDPTTNSMYWALNSVDQVGEKAQAQLISERKENGPYFSFEEFLDRHLFKGSAVNKSVIENLIYSGAFDKLNQSDGSPFLQRETLLQQYRKNQKVKIDPTKDDYTIAHEKGKTSLEWWWQLQQKKKSGFGFFDYKTLVKTYLSPNIGKDVNFISAEDLKKWKATSDNQVAMGGYVLEIQERKSKKGPFCNLVLESNYEFIKVLVYPELFEDYGEFLRGCEGNLLLLNGFILYNKFHDEYVLQTSNYTEFIGMSIV